MKIKELLSDQSKWCQKHCALDIYGRPAESISREAVCWCLFGAMRRCYCSDDKFGEIWTRIEIAIGQSATHWNDHQNRTFDDVKALVERLDV